MLRASTTEASAAMRSEQRVIGNSWGGGSTSGGGVGGVFVYMMKDLANTLAAAATAKKVDIIFVLDETASMVDNIRGIRAYVDFSL